MFRSFLDHNQGAVFCFSLLKLYYNIHNLIRFCKHGVVAACQVVWEYAVDSAAGYVMRDWLWVT